MSNFFTPFRIVLLFISIALFGVIVLPSLPISLLPGDNSRRVDLSFSLPNSSPDVVEQQVTCVLENALSQLTQLIKINSDSWNGKGRVVLFFEQHVDLQMKMFEIALLLRQVYPKLPAGTSYPLISGGVTSSSEKDPLMVFSIHAPRQAFEIQQTAEEILQKTFAGKEGVRELQLSGTPGLQITIAFDKEYCRAWHIQPAQIIRAIQSRYLVSYPGSVSTGNGLQYFMHVKDTAAGISAIENIVVSLSPSYTIRIKDLARVYIEEQEPLGYFRINGKNGVFASIYVQEGTNRLMLGRAIKQWMLEAAAQFPSDYTILHEYDDTEFLEKELHKNYRRATLSIGILMLFIFISYRNIRYLLIFMSGLLVNLALTVIIVWLFGITIHLYTIAALAISFGIMIDNIIVMIDYYRKYHKPAIITALLGATCTTIAALMLVKFLPEGEQNSLAEFSGIICISLATSLLISLWFIPGLYTLLVPGDPGMNGAKKLPPLRRLIVIKRLYHWCIHGMATWRKTGMAMLVLLFGLPVFMLPREWEGKRWYHRWYHHTIGTDYYQDDIKPYVDKWLGGALYRFTQRMNLRSGIRELEKNRLYVQAKLSLSNTVEQMNTILQQVEQDLSSVPGIDKYVTRVQSGQFGQIEITFKEAYEHSELPYELKSQLINRSLDWAGVDWNVYGVGQGFSNASGNELPTFRVIMKGYNYDELERQARMLGQKLLLHARIKKVNTDDNLRRDEQQGQEYTLLLQARQMALNNTNRNSLLRSIVQFSKPAGSVDMIAINDRYYPLQLKEKGSGSFSAYQLFNQPVVLDSNHTIRLRQFARLDLHNTAGVITRENRQYTRVVGFEYIGAELSGREYLDNVLTGLEDQLPAGYTAQHNMYRPKREKEHSLLILVLIAINFFICSVLFENLRQPLFIICTIPVSFIGLFLIFSWSDYYFDQGGYAAFVLLGGLVVNAAIFIVNDFNNLRKDHPRSSQNRLLIKAIMHRARTILLTTISTCCGLIPFIIEGDNEVFWFSFAWGAMGGLLFSLVAVFIMLPMLLWNKK